MKKRGTNLIVCMLCAALAFTFTVQIRSVKRNNNVKGADQLRAEELQKSLTNEADKNKKLEQQLDQYKRDIDEMRRLMGEDGTISEAVLSQLQNAEVLAGTVAVEGPGVSVMMDDMGRLPAGSADPNQFVIHDSDILQVLSGCVMRARRRFRSTAAGACEHGSALRGQRTQHQQRADRGAVRNPGHRGPASSPPAC
ncbi:MAG: DUF881 domain-containing protein [Oscillospiraceae bacterium]